MFVTKGHAKTETESTYVFAKTNIFTTHKNGVHLEVMLYRMLML